MQARAKARRVLRVLLALGLSLPSLAAAEEGPVSAPRVADPAPDPLEAWTAPGPLPERAERARAKGWLAEEIVPVRVPRAKGEELTVAVDEHPRPGTTAAELARLRPLVRPDGTVTAGNSSGVNDGACALVVGSEAAARRHGLEPLARVVATAAAGVPPRIMGIAAAPAAERALARAGLGLAAMDWIELNEAFAAQALAVTRELGLADDDPRLNPNGGAIALGHPLGMSGARLLTTALYQLLRSGGRYALCTMCIGVGQGVAAVLERVGERRPPGGGARP